MIPEHVHLKTFAQKYPRYISLRTLTEIDTRTGPEPLYAFNLYDHKTKAKNLPVLGLFAGVHGIEYVGVKILISFLEYILNQIQWNGNLKYMLKQVRIVGIPIVNPAGFVAYKRANGNGVDLMRNAPVDGPRPMLLVGGQRISNRLPWFRGKSRFEQEAQQLVRLVEDELWQAPFCLSLDLHSGFGIKDYLWTPYAKQIGLPPTWSEYTRIKEVLKSSLRSSKYYFCPQSTYYTTNGDLWDYLYDRHLEREDLLPGRFLPLTLELGTWRFIKKTPLAGLRWWNYFNPNDADNFKSMNNQHLPLLTLLAHIAANWQRVFPQTA